MRVGIHQPNYIPWLGYFRKIALCDVFVFFDNVQMPGGKSFVSRNAVKTAAGRTWLTVPVAQKGAGTRIADVHVVDDGWQRKHLRTLDLAYAHASFKGLVRDAFAPVLEAKHALLSDLNIALIQQIATLLGLAHVRFVRATEMSLVNEGAASIDEILQRTQATEYFTGAGEGSMRHLDVDAFAAEGIKTTFVEWSCDAYAQPHGPFEANLSALDALLNLGPQQAARLIGAHAP